MMISPNAYVEMLKDNTFEELLAERDSLFLELKELEKIVFQDDKSHSEWMVCPGPDVRYQMDLEYLAALCKYIQEKYNREIVRRDEQDEDEWQD